MGPFIFLLIQLLCEHLYSSFHIRRLILYSISLEYRPFYVLNVYEDLLLIAIGIYEVE